MDEQFSGEIGVRVLEMVRRARGIVDDSLAIVGDREVVPEEETIGIRERMAELVNDLAHLFADD